MTLFRMREPVVVRPKITPDPTQVAALERRMSELNYRPRNGFHRDARQDRQTRTRW